MYIQVRKGITIKVTTYGDENNPAIILLHGIGADHQMFSPQIENYANNGYYVIAPDMRGHGESSKAEQLELSDFTYDVQKILNHLKINKAIIIGVSMGGVIAQQFIVDYPDRVSKLIIVDSFGELKSIIERFIGKAQVLGFKLFKYLPRKMGANLFASAYKNLSKEAVDYFSSRAFTIDYDQLVMARKAINKIDVLQDLKKIEVPSLIIVGDEVKLMIKANKKIANSLINSRLVILSKSMDPSNLISPEEFNREVLNFING